MKKVNDAYKQFACVILNTIIDDARKPKMYEDVIYSLISKRLDLFLSIAEVRKENFMNTVLPILKETEKRIIAENK